MFYGTNTVKTALVAKRLKKAFGDAEVDVVSVEVPPERFEQYDNAWFWQHLPTGMNWPTWFAGIEGEESCRIRTGRSEVNYPENFVDGIGILDLDGFFRSYTGGKHPPKDIFWTVAGVEGRTIP